MNENKYFQVDFQKNNSLIVSVFTHLVKATNRKDVETAYKKYPWFDIEEITLNDFNESAEDGTPIIDLI